MTAGAGHRGEPGALGGEGADLHAVRGVESDRQVETEIVVPTLPFDLQSPGLRGALVRLAAERPDRDDPRRGRRRIIGLFFVRSGALAGLRHARTDAFFEVLLLRHC